MTGLVRMFAHTFLALCFCVPSPSGATSLAAIRAHSPEFAQSAIERLVADIDSNDLRRLDASGILPFVYTDRLGMVEWEDRDAFLAAMNRSDGREDAAPIRIVHLRSLTRHKYYPVYLVTIEREVWRLKAYETDDMLPPVEIDHPHYEREPSTWLVAFRGNSIASLRQADELALAAREGAEVEP